MVGEKVAPPANDDLQSVVELVCSAARHGDECARDTTHTDAGFPDGSGYFVKGLPFGAAAKGYQHTDCNVYHDA